MAENSRDDRLQRPQEGDFLAEVLGGLTDLPESLAERLGALLDEEDRATAIRELFEELSRE